jgi:hypothetical protein
MIRKPTKSRWAGGLLRGGAHDHIHLIQGIDDPGEISQVLLTDRTEALLVEVEQSRAGPEAGRRVRTDDLYSSTTVGEAHLPGSPGQAVIEHPGRHPGNQSSTPGLGPCLDRRCVDLLILQEDTRILEQSSSRPVDLRDLILV